MGPEESEVLSHAMLRTVRESCGIKPTHPPDFNSCQDLLPVVVILLSANQ